MLRVRVRPEDVAMLLPRGTFETEELLVRLRAKLPTLTYHQLYRFLSRLAEQGAIEKIKVRIIYYDPKTGRKYHAVKVLWRVR